MRHTHAHTRNRRSHHALAGSNVVVDKESGNPRQPHRLDETTGTYRGKQIVSKNQLKKEARKERAKASEHEHVHGENTNTQIEEREQKKGILGRVGAGKGKAKARSGMGGNAGS
jgi:large subunit ribosomal protein L32